MNRTLQSLIVASITCTLLSACQQDQDVPLPNDICQLTLPAVGHIQGSQDTSPAAEQEVTVRAVVTAVLPGEGYFLHDPIGDSDPTSSEGLWVQDKETPFPGELWALRGTIEEQVVEGRRNLIRSDNSITTLTKINGRQLCADNQVLPVAEFPLPSQHREALESMRVRLPADLQVVAVPNRFQQYGLTLASERIFSPTEMVRPGAAAQALQQRFDTASMNIALPPNRYSYRVGDQLEAVAGIYDLRGDAQIISTAAPQVKAAAGIPAPPDPSGSLRMVSMNLLNYFNGDGSGGGFPTPRGAESPQDFAQQRERITAAIQALDPAIIAVQELENDDDSELSAAADLASSLNNAIGSEVWTWVKTPTSSSDQADKDAIRVGIFYRTDRVHPASAPIFLNSPPFHERHRPVLAQRFFMQPEEKVTELTSAVLVASVHLKSKGSCPEEGLNSNQNDGQACWNAARKEAAGFLAQWLREQIELHSNQLAGGILLGDFNSYRAEDPVRAMTRAGLVELVGQHASPPLYSYVYRGQRGTLDYAFATPSMIPYLTLAEHWHVNSDESDLIHQHSDATQPRAAWRRFSDHDPLIVDLRFSTH